MEKSHTDIKGLKIRKMRRDEAEFVTQMEATEGWIPGIHDGEIFYETDPDGFFIAEVEGEPIGCVSAVAYDDSYGFLGLYVVKPEFRNKSVGAKLTEKCLERMGNRNIGLDAVVENEKKYQDFMNFKSFYRNLRFEGRGGGEVPDGLIKISDVPFESLLKYDREMFPAPRPVFLEKWIKQPDSYAFATVEAGKLKGYGVIRKCLIGYKIGPLFADDEIKAEKIFQALKASIPDEVVFVIDVPEPNERALEITRKYGMDVVFTTIRMYSREEPNINLGKVYGSTTLELG
ncbi:GNAT family N-acetyltransferase [Methanosarcina sp.]|uniref:GNAT family N-acetyltransferase n=1 Tax=Methanosarcina sp. TaxID=2213 RepID=UPI0029892797|nr:GNAT family N-acetyltransferase [Methanosarcina sp.]MDW5552115.1 GNAT family N-acetyltransferase [Methanosarcina sp.]MDW5555603.1 GNAT family N-acetyltransferase [Methanosarcina sp.]MDW5561409.1 GNAT family N-acetyltransferase [Methanosarcina sp.]